MLPLDDHFVLDDTHLQFLWSKMTDVELKLEVISANRWLQDPDNDCLMVI